MNKLILCTNLKKEEKDNLPPLNNDGYWLDITPMYTVGEYGTYDGTTFIASKDSNTGGSSATDYTINLNSDNSIVLERIPVLIKFTWTTFPTTKPVNVNLYKLNGTIYSFSIVDSTAKWFSFDIGEQIDLSSEDDVFSLTNILAYIPPSDYYKSSLIAVGNQTHAHLGCSISSSIVLNHQ